MDDYARISPYRPANLTEYTGDYLLLTTPAGLDEVEPLAEQKRRRGFAVTVATVDTIGVDCASLQAYITDWQSAHPDRDHYVLIVGDQELIGTCIWRDLYASDRLLASTDGADIHAEVHLGRLPCSTEPECEDMVNKILEYEDGYPGWFVGRVLLAAAVNDEDKDFVGVMDGVKDAAYAVPPTFQTLYAADGTTNADVRAAVDAGAGVVAYLGHGEVPLWSRWNGTDFDLAELALLANGDRRPSAVSFACHTGNFTRVDTDGLGETWLQTAERAVAFYGATFLTNFSYVEVLAAELFETLYDEGTVILGDALDATVEPLIDRWYGVAGIGEYNVGMYVLFGDPDMKLWREPPEIPEVGGYPADVPPEPGVIEVEVRVPGAPGERPSGALAPGDPIDLAIVSLYKPGDFQINRYTDQDGRASLPIAPTSPGWIHLTVYTEFDSRAPMADSIEVLGPTDVGEGPRPIALALHCPAPNPFPGGTTIAYELARPGPVRLSVYDVRGRLVATLVDRSQDLGRHRAAWNGRDASGRLAPSGIYVIALQSGGELRTQKAVALR